jgi:hypothetical protein
MRGIVPSGVEPDRLNPISEAQSETSMRSAVIDKLSYELAEFWQCEGRG